MSRAMRILCHALTFALVSLPALASSNPPSCQQESAMEITIPFPFRMEGRRFPAGEYRVEIHSCNPFMAAVRTPTSHDWAATLRESVPAVSLGAHGAFRLVFRRTANGKNSRYELLELRSANSTSRAVYAITGKRPARCSARAPLVNSRLAFR